MPNDEAIGFLIAGILIIVFGYFLFAAAAPLGKWSRRNGENQVWTGLPGTRLGWQMLGVFFVLIGALSTAVGLIDLIN